MMIYSDGFSEALEASDQQSPELEKCDLFHILMGLLDSGVLNMGEY